jgi:hypothetical protein
MEYKILSNKQVQQFESYFNGQRTLVTKIEILEYQKLKVSDRQRFNQLPQSVRSCLIYIDILIEFANKIVEERNIKGQISITFGEYLHLLVTTQNEIYDDYKKYIGINTEKHVIQYFNEIKSLLQVNTEISQDAVNRAASLIKNHGFLQKKYQKFVVPLFELEGYVRPNNNETNIFTLLEQALQILDPKLIALSQDLSEFIVGIDPFVLTSIIQHKQIPLYKPTKKLTMKSDRKADIVRFADFFGLSISEINFIFDPPVDSNDRNKKAKTGGILTVLNKYKSLRKK